MPPVEIELEIPHNIQIAALMSLGLVYVKSGNKHLSYVLLKEIGRLPGSEIDKDVHSFDREAYSLTAGLALGMILLEQGKKSLAIMDSTFTDELYHYMVGGHKERYSNDAGSSSDFRLGQSSYIREGESINTNVTCPGATIALGLIYFNSCDKLISEWFSPPDSAFLLDSIRPDFLLLRTVARNLIMWKFVLPSQKWLVSQLSNILKTCLKNDQVLNEKFSSLVNVDVKKSSSDFVKIEKREMEMSSEDEINDDTDDDDNVVVDKETKKKKHSSHILADIIQFDDVDDDLLLEERGKEEDEVSNANSNASERSENLIDEETKVEAFRHIVAGACMSIGLKFAGSFNNEAYQTLVNLNLKYGLFI